MDAWNELLKQALLGTERHPLRMPSATGALGELLSQLDVSDKEAALLRASGAVAAYCRAGTQTEPSTDALPAPKSDTWRTCSIRASKHFSMLLDGMHSEILIEWLEVAAKSRKRIPEEFLPAALSMGQNRRELRAALTEVVGERGRWLGTQNSDWNFVTGSGEHNADEARKHWELGSADSRVELLRGVIRTNPDLANELLRSTWKEDAAADRARFLNLCSLSAPNAVEEAFLEKCLSDKRKEVREEAVGILQRRPTSQFVTRNVHRAKNCVALVMKGKKRVLEITLPDACDKDMERDGIDPKEMPFRMGEKSAILHQVLCNVPPEIWSKAAPVEEWLSSAKESDHDALLLHAWRTATVRFGDEAWAEALLNLAVDKKQAHSRFLPFRALPFQKKESFLMARLKEENGVLTNAEQDQDGVLALLLQCSHAWSPAFARAVVTSLKQHAAREVDWSLRTQIKRFALHIPIGLNTEVQKDWPIESKNWDGWREQVDGFLSLLQFRSDIHEALSEEN